jgi:hypothetical protein
MIHKGSAWKRLTRSLIPRNDGDAKLGPNEEIVQVSGLSNVRGWAGMDKPFHS